MGQGSRTAARPNRPIEYCIGGLRFLFSGHDTMVNGRSVPELMEMHSFRMTDTCYLRQVENLFGAGNIIGLLALEMLRMLKPFPTTRDAVLHVRARGIYLAINDYNNVNDKKYRDPILKMIEAGFYADPDAKPQTGIELEAFKFGEYARAFCF